MPKNKIYFSLYFFVRKNFTCQKFHSISIDFKILATQALYSQYMASLVPYFLLHGIKFLQSLFDHFPN